MNSRRQVWHVKKYSQGKNCEGFITKKEKEKSNANNRVVRIHDNSIEKCRVHTGLQQYWILYTTFPSSLVLQISHMEHCHNIFTVMSLCFLCFCKVFVNEIWQQTFYVVLVLIKTFKLDKTKYVLLNVNNFDKLKRIMFQRNVWWWLSKIYNNICKTWQKRCFSLLLFCHCKCISTWRRPQL